MEFGDGEFHRGSIENLWRGGIVKFGWRGRDGRGVFAVTEGGGGRTLSLRVLFGHRAGGRKLGTRFFVGLRVKEMGIRGWEGRDGAILFRIGVGLRRGDETTGCGRNDQSSGEITKGGGATFHFAPLVSFRRGAGEIGVAWRLVRGERCLASCAWRIVRDERCVASGTSRVRR